MRRGVLHLCQQRFETALDAGIALARHEYPQQRRARVPVVYAGAGAHQRLLERRRNFVHGPPSQKSQHALGHRKRLARSLLLTRGKTVQHRANLRRAPRIVQPGHHQFTLESRRKVRVAVTQLGQRTLDDINRVRPPEQRRVHLRDLEGDLGTFSRLGD